MPTFKVIIRYDEIKEYHYEHDIEAENYDAAEHTALKMSNNGDFDEDLRRDGFDFWCDRAEFHAFALRQPIKQ